MKHLLSGFILALIITVSGYTQVTIAPTNLFLDTNKRIGTYMVINNGNQIQEVSIDFLFSYIQTDENGERTPVEENTEITQKHSITEYIRAFPQSFTIAPGQRQVVRLRVNPPNNLEDGTYWARIRTTSSPETPPVELQSGDAVTATVGIEIQQVTGLFYKNGTVNTGIEIDDIRTEFEEVDDLKRLITLTDVRRTGNSPFLGSITVSLTNSQGEEVRRSYISTSVYFDSVHRQVFDIDDLPAGSYTVTTTFETIRADISTNELVQMTPVSESRTFTIR